MILGTVDPQSAYYCMQIIPVTSTSTSGSYVDTKHRVQATQDDFFMQSYKNVFNYVNENYFSETKNGEKNTLYSDEYPLI